MLKILEKLKRKDDLKIVAIVAKRKFNTESYDSFVETKTKKNFCDLKRTLKVVDFFLQL